MVEYSKVNVKLMDTQLKKLKTAVKDKAGATLRTTLKMFDKNDLSHELLLTTRRKTKLRIDRFYQTFLKSFSELFLLYL